MKPLSERLLEAAEWEIHMPTELREWLEEAAALAKSVESAPTGEVWQHAYIDGQRSSSIVITREPEDGLAIMGQRVSLVPLPQQSET